MSLFDKYLLSPKKMLLVDALGATLTALLLAGILIPFQKIFGMPLEVLIMLASFAGIFAGNSFLSLIFPSKYQLGFLKVMVFWNSLYCCATAFFCVIYYERLTVLGFVYFILETLIIVGLVFLEIKCINRQQKAG